MYNVMCVLWGRTRESDYSYTVIDYSYLPWNLLSVFEYRLYITPLKVPNKPTAQFTSASTTVLYFGDNFMPKIIILLSSHVCTRNRPI
jgi:hypothetical protein